MSDRKRETLELRGTLFTAKTLSVCMAYDAFRLALGGKPTLFTSAEILLWLQLVAKDTQND
jgi:hypothetical protein